MLLATKYCLVKSARLRVGYTPNLKKIASVVTSANHQVKSNDSADKEESSQAYINVAKIAGSSTPKGDSRIKSNEEKGIEPSIQDRGSIDKPSTTSSTLSTARTTAIHIYESTIYAVKNPMSVWVSIKDVAHHYWVGTKLLWSEIKLATAILKRLVQGSAMTRRERLQLIRTTTDIFRLVPFAIFVIVPFMELLLPLALKLFPNMLPSTFQDDLKKEETMKRELQMRLAVAGFMQDTLKEMVSKRVKTVDDTGTGGCAQDLIEFVEKAKIGEPLEKVGDSGTSLKSSMIFSSLGFRD